MSSAAAEQPIVAGLVSTIIPVYNRALLMREAVQSVLDQTYEAIEIIVVDDGSTDDTASAIDALANDPRVRHVALEHQGRAGLVREAGRRQARGEFIQYLDSDDLLRPRRFEVMVAALRARPDCDIAYSFGRRYELGAAPLDVPIERTGETFEHLLPISLSRRPWHTAVPLYRRSLCDRAGAWSDLMFWEDVEYDMRIAAMHPRLVHCREFLADTRDHALGRLARPHFFHDAELLREGVRAHLMVHSHAKAWGASTAYEAFRLFLDQLRVVAWRCHELGLQRELEACEKVLLMERAQGPWRERPRLKAVIKPSASSLRGVPSGTINLPVRVLNESDLPFGFGELSFSLSYHLRSERGDLLSFANRRTPFTTLVRPGGQTVVDLIVTAPPEPGRYVVEIDLVWDGFEWFATAGGTSAIVSLVVERPLLFSRPPHERVGSWVATADGRRLNSVSAGGLRPRTVLQAARSRLRLASGVEPLSYEWGSDRGQPVHRYYVEAFLSEFASDIKGQCLEFQNAVYVPRYGGTAVSGLDILHADDSNSGATLVADLTTPNNLPGVRFDCIVCTHVLHLIFDMRRAVSELHRILKPGGVLLVAVPQVSMCGPEFHELWRFTAEGLFLLLTEHFDSDDVIIRAYGNSLTAAGEIRGLTADEFRQNELETHDLRFAPEICARAVRR